MKIKQMKNKEESKAKKIGDKENDIMNEETMENNIKDNKQMKLFQTEQMMMEKALEIIKKDDLQKENGEICCVSEFEKDVDDNFHIDFIHSFANLRAKNYRLEPMDWITVKIKAGKIVPALATTTACISALQTIEMCKILQKNYKPSSMKNAFLSLALPFLAFSEPVAPVYKQINAKHRVCLWDRWEIKLGNENDCLESFFTFLRKFTGGLAPRDLFQGSRPIFISSMMNSEAKKDEKDEVMNTRLEYLLDFKVYLLLYFCKKKKKNY
jgi:hypothetical protein